MWTSVINCSPAISAGELQDSVIMGEKVKLLCCWWIILLIMKWFQEHEKMTETLAYGYSFDLRVFSESYQINTNMTGFKWFSKIFVSKSSLSIGRVKTLCVNFNNQLSLFSCNHCLWATEINLITNISPEQPGQIVEYIIMHVCLYCRRIRDQLLDLLISIWMSNL